MHAIRLPTSAELSRPTIPENDSGKSFVIVYSYEQAMFLSIIQSVLKKYNELPTDELSDVPLNNAEKSTLLLYLLV